MAQSDNLGPAVWVSINGATIGPAIAEFKNYKEARDFIDKLRKQAQSMKSKR